ncbi:hypothetical protein AA3990_1435 [Gluconobacter roseus NBRC 3990]|nr:hypothetical protein AA3990_1435 [Gluconobacter roseus NBRC 3990]
MQMRVERPRAQEQGGMTIRRDFGVVWQSKRAIPGLGQIDHAGSGLSRIADTGGQQRRKDGAGQKGATQDM